MSAGAEEFFDRDCQHRVELRVAHAHAKVRQERRLKLAIMPSFFARSSHALRRELPPDKAAGRATRG
jgi:hypothetical protein